MLHNTIPIRLRDTIYTRCMMRHDDNNPLGIFSHYTNSPNLKFQPVQVLSMTSVSRLRVIPDYSTIEVRNIMLNMILAVMRPERTPQYRRQQRP